ncbi:Reticulon-like protein 1 [Neolecta irregularis DAH-3]|uniref:Reticulon-like protein n=1 Tax=Neolecta irregularis (strain DAH-3) TaxID=1198029 RepID=A0A1U7LTV3_NEOID|nr:Reticulon-like protein 1 [Neolecta irregularis DAH-3]|eukprot:OLL26100.1 Reticulon-like protein 1 [Neolecta irregularis DAH-3]
MTQTCDEASIPLLSENTVPLGESAASIPATGGKPSALSSQLGTGKKSDHNQVTLTKYHSFFNELFTWKYPRASGVVFGTILTTLFVTKYFNILRFVFKVLWMAFLASASLEYGGRLMTRNNSGLMSQFRPTGYYSVSKEIAEPFLSELHQLWNFLLLEFQKLAYATNPKHTLGAFLAAWVSCQLVTYLSVLSLLIIATLTAFTTPAVYVRHQKVVDEHLDRARVIINQNLSTVKEAASRHADVVVEQARYYAQQASEKIGASSPFLQGKLAAEAKQNNSFKPARSPLSQAPGAKEAPVEVAAL